MPIAPPRGKGKPPWQPTEQDRRTVELMHACGVTEVAIAKVIGVGEQLLRKRCRVELDTGLAKANAAVAQFLFTGIVGSATKPPFADERNRMVAAMFWLKCRAGWKETVTHEMIRPVTEMTDEEIRLRLEMDEKVEQANVVKFKPRR